MQLPREGVTTTHNPHRATGHPNWRLQSIMLLLFYSIPSDVKVIIDFVPLLHLCNCCAHKFAIGERHITINLPTILSTYLHLNHCYYSLILSSLRSNHHPYII